LSEELDAFEAEARALQAGPPPDLPDDLFATERPNRYRAIERVREVQERLYRYPQVLNDPTWARSIPRATAGRENGSSRIDRRVSD
jgi:hypothetical protein